MFIDTSRKNIKKGAEMVGEEVRQQSFKLLWKKENEAVHVY